VDLVLSAEQDLLQQTVREFVAGRSSLKRVRGLRDDGDPEGFSRTLWAEMARLGWLGIVLPVEHGGLGLGYMELMVVMEELGRGLMPEPMLSARHPHVGLRRELVDRRGHFRGFRLITGEELRRDVPACQFIGDQRLHPHNLLAVPEFQVDLLSTLVLLLVRLHRGACSLRCEALDRRRR